MAASGLLRAAGCSLLAAGAGCRTTHVLGFPVLAYPGGVKHPGLNGLIWLGGGSIPCSKQGPRWANGSPKHTRKL